MSKIRTLLQLHDAIAEETGWRKQELALVMSNVNLGRGLAQKVALRGAVALLYAHWEGWIKSVAKLYVRYVNSQRLQLSELSPPFLGNALKTRFNASTESSKARIHTELATVVVHGLADRARLSEELIQSESNLSSEVLDDLSARIGIDPGFFETKENLVDEQLLRRRNSIAHGEFEDISLDDYHALHAAIIGMLESFTTQVLAGASQSDFRSLSP